MKAKDRHRLKTNELAQTLGNMLDYIRKHGNLILTIAVIALVVVVGGGLLLKSRFKGQQNRQKLLYTQLRETSGLMAASIQQAAAALQAQADDPTQPLPTPITVPYDVEANSKVLGNLSQQAQGSAVGMTALLQQAEVIRSTLFFSDQDLSLNQKQQLFTQVTDIYNRILQQYPEENWVVGIAQMGLALVAEEMGQWDQAQQIYDEIIADTDGIFAGSVFPHQAQRRLDLREDISSLIEFPLTPPLPEINLEDLFAPEDFTLPDPNKLPQIAPQTATDPNILLDLQKQTIKDPNTTPEDPIKTVEDPNKAAEIIKIK
ncbi:tol-pal system YbgF family protein [Planctomycetota bacterium]